MNSLPSLTGNTTVARFLPNILNRHSIEWFFDYRTDFAVPVGSSTEIREHIFFQLQLNKTLDEYCFKCVNGYA